MKLTDGEWVYNPVLRTISAGDCVIADLHFSDAAHDEMDNNGLVMAASKQLFGVCCKTLEDLTDAEPYDERINAVCDMIRDALNSLTPQPVA